MAGRVPVREARIENLVRGGVPPVGHDDFAGIGRQHMSWRGGGIAARLVHSQSVMSSTSGAVVYASATVGSRRLILAEINAKGALRVESRSRHVACSP